MKKRLRSFFDLGLPATVVIASGVGGLLFASVQLVGCGEVLGVAGLREESDPDAASDAGTTSDAYEAATVAQDAGPCPLAAHQACNPILQCGCAIDENCEVTLSTGTTSCSSIGKTPLWGNCTTFGECQKGAECVIVDHACKPFCATAQDCPAPPMSARFCEPVLVGGKPIPDLTVCSAGCDLLNPSVVCGPGVTCNPAPWDGNGTDHTDCFGGVGTGIGPGACPKNDSTLCAPGYSCLANACAKWCRVGHNEDCTTPATCTTLAKTPQIGLVLYGLCQ